MRRLTSQLSGGKLNGPTTRNCRSVEIDGLDFSDGQRSWTVPGRLKNDLKSKGKIIKEILRRARSECKEAVKYREKALRSSSASR